MFYLFKTTCACGSISQHQRVAWCKSIYIKIVIIIRCGIWNVTHYTTNTIKKMRVSFNEELFYLNQENYFLLLNLVKIVFIRKIDKQRLNILKEKNWFLNSPEIEHALWNNFKFIISFWWSRISTQLIQLDMHSCMNNLLMNQKEYLQTHSTIYHLWYRSHNSRCWLCAHTLSLVLIATITFLLNFHKHIKKKLSHLISPS